MRLGFGLFSAVFTLACTTPVKPLPPPELPDEAPRAALTAFLAAEQGHDFNRAYALLSAPLRARYTPERLEKDHDRDAELAADKLSRIRAALSNGQRLEVKEGHAALVLGPDRATELVREPDGWHVAAIE